MAPSLKEHRPVRSRNVPVRRAQRLNPQGIDVENTPQSLIDTGFLFHINQCVLHPCGYALEVRPIPGKPGARKLVLVDYSNNPTVLFDANTFKDGHAKFTQFWRTRGIRNSRLRKEKLGYVTQLPPEEDEF